MGYKPGQSGNPKGRPPRDRALSELLSRAANGKIQTGGKSVAAKKHVADLIWSGLCTGAINFEGRRVELDAGEWVNLLKFVYSQIDGPPSQHVELSSGGEKSFDFKIQYVAPRKSE